MSGQPALLLLVGAERQQRMRRQAVHADGHRDGGPARGDLLEHLQVHLVRLAAAAPLLGLRQAQQARGAELREHAVGVRLGPLVLVDDRIEHLVGDVAGQRDQLRGLVGGEQAVDRHGCIS